MEIKKFKKFVVLLLIILVYSAKIFLQEVEQQKPVDPFQQAIENISNPDPYVRRQAAEQLGTLRDLRAVPYLKKLLKDDNPFVRQTAVDSLGLLRAEDALPELSYILLNDKEPQVRQSVAVAMGYIGSKQAVKPLIEVLSSTTTPPAVRYAACSTLGILRSTEAVTVMISLLSEPDINLKKSIVFALGKIQVPEVSEIFRDMLDTEQDENLIIDIIRILIETTDKKSVEKLKNLYTTTKSEKIKIYSAIGLAQINNDVTVLPTIKQGLKSSDETIKILSINAIGNVGDEESLKMLKSMEKTEQSPYVKTLLQLAIQRLESKLPKPTTKTTTPEKKP